MINQEITTNFMNLPLPPTPQPPIKYQTTASANAPSLKLPCATAPSVTVSSSSPRVNCQPVPTFIEFENDYFHLPLIKDGRTRGVTRSNVHFGEERECKEEVKDKEDGEEPALSNSDIVGILDDFGCWIGDDNEEKNDGYSSSSKNNNNVSAPGLNNTYTNKQHSEFFVADMHRHDNVNTLIHRHRRRHHHMATKKSQHQHHHHHNISKDNNVQQIDEEALPSLFVGSEVGDQQRVSRRMDDFLAYKISLFGTEKAGKKITLQDLDDDDHAVLQSGVIQILSERDQDGRLVVFCDIGWMQSSVWWNLNNQKSVLRVIYYVAMVAIQDETVQNEQGLTWIIYNMMDCVPTLDTIQSNVLEGIAHLRHVLPVRCADVHFCSDDPGFLLTVSDIHMETQVHGRSECETYHIHNVESPHACAAKLASIGIPAQLLPIPNSTSTAILESHKEWLRLQGQKEMDEALLTLPFYQQLQKDRMMDFLEPTPIHSVASAGAHPAMYPILWGSTSHKESAHSVCSARSNDDLSSSSLCAVNRLRHLNNTATQGLIPQQIDGGLAGYNPFVVSLTSPPSFRSIEHRRTSSVTGINDLSPQISLGRQNILGSNEVSPIPLDRNSDDATPTASNRITHARLFAPSLSNIDLSCEPCSPRQFDVLFGRGKVKDHYGNIHLHKIIAMQQEKYDAAERWEKTIIAEDIVSSIRSHDGRFLRLVTVHNQHGSQKQWVEVDTDTAREKVSHTFRSKRTKITKGSGSSVVDKAACGVVR